MNVWTGWVMLEKRLYAVTPQLFTSNGGADGTISVADTRLFKVKQEVYLTANTLPNLDTIEVKRIVSRTQLIVGPKGGNINATADVSAYTTGLQAKIAANEQKRPAVPYEEYMRAVYEEEPTVAVRSMLVDKDGKDYRIDNPLPVELSTGSVSIGTVNAELEVALSHKDNTPNPGDVADSVRIGDGAEELAINADSEALVHDQDTHDRLDTVNTTLEDEFDETQTLLQTEFNETQVKLDNIHTRQLDKTQFTKLTDGTNDGIIDSDRNLHVEIAGNRADGTNQVLTLEDDGRANVVLKGIVSTGNSTTAALGANGIFTGTFREVKDFSFVSFSVFTDQSSASNGLEFQWSMDGINVDRTESTNVVANAGRAFAITVRARYFRIRYTNGPVAQTVFRLGTTLHSAGSGLITKPLKGAVNEDNFAQLVQAPVMAKLRDGTFENIWGLKLNGTSLLGTVDHDAVFGDLGHTFGITTDYVSTGTGENPFLLIRNPAGSGKTMRIDRLIFGIPSGGSSVYRCYMSPTVTTTGTEVFPVGHRQTGQSTPVCRFFVTPTTSAFGSKFFSTRIDTNSVPFDYTYDYSRLLEPGFDLLVTAQPSAGGATSSVSAEYSET